MGKALYSAYCNVGLSMKTISSIIFLNGELINIYKQGFMQFLRKQKQWEIKRLTP